MPPPLHPSFAQWFDSYAGPLVLYARQWLDAQQAEDAVQEAFIDLLRQRSAPPNVRAWLYRGVRQTALSAIRAAQRRRPAAINPLANRRRNRSRGVRRIVPGPAALPNSPAGPHDTA